MIFYIFLRLLYTIPVCLAVSLVCFLLVHLAPGDPVSAFLPPQASAELIAKVTADLGLDRPIYEQFYHWLIRVVQGDLGTSIATNRDVFTDVTRAFGNSLILAALAVPISLIAGFTLGGVAGYFRGSLIDRATTMLAITGVSVPHYWLAIVLVILFSVESNLLPAMGAGPAGSDQWVWDWEHVRFAVLPAVSMAVVPTSIIARTVKAVVAEILTMEHIRALRAKGLAEGRIMLHVLKNAAPTSIAVAGVQIGYLLGGSILIETVFAWPGAGYLLNTAIFQRDLPVLQGTILILALFFVLLNLLVDLAQVVIDPRVKRY